MQQQTQHVLSAQIIN